MFDMQQDTQKFEAYFGDRGTPYKMNRCVNHVAIRLFSFMWVTIIEILPRRKSKTGLEVRG